MKKRITEYLAYIDALLDGTVCIGNCDFNLVFEF